MSSLTSCWRIHTRYKSRQIQRDGTGCWWQGGIIHRVSQGWWSEGGGATIALLGFVLEQLLLLLCTQSSIIYYAMFCDMIPICSVEPEAFLIILIIQFDFRQRGRKTDLSIFLETWKQMMLKACKTILLVYHYTANFNWLWNKLRASPNWWLQSGGGMGAILTRHPQPYKADFPAEHFSPLQRLREGDTSCPLCLLQPVPSDLRTGEVVPFRDAGLWADTHCCNSKCHRQHLSNEPGYHVPEHRNTEIGSHKISWLSRI